MRRGPEEIACARNTQSVGGGSHVIMLHLSQIRDCESPLIFGRACASIGTRHDLPGTCMAGLGRATSPGIPNPGFPLDVQFRDIRCCHVASELEPKIKIFSRLVQEGQLEEDFGKDFS